MKVNQFKSRNILQIIDDLHDAPGEAIAVALGDAVYNLTDASPSGFEFYVNEADAILERLRKNGFDIVASPPRLLKIRASTGHERVTVADAKHLNDIHRV